MKIVILVVSLLLVACQKEETPATTVNVVQTAEEAKQVIHQETVEETEAERAVRVAEREAERVAKIAENEADYQKLELALSKLTDREYEALVSAGMPEWKVALERHKALKKLTDEDMRSLELEDKLSLETGD